MARALSHLMSNILGSVGGITYFNGPYHQIQMRIRGVPTNPNTTFQEQARAAFASAIAAWEQATPTQRAEWAGFAFDIVFNGPLGPYNPTGRNLAIAQFQIIQYLETVAGVVFTDPADMAGPTLQGMQVISVPEIKPLAAAGTGFGITFDNLNGEEVHAYAIRSLQMSNARNFFKGPFFTSSIQDAAVVDAATGVLEFDTLVDGGIYFVKLRLVSEDSPRRYSNDIILRAVASITV